eukprot:9523370-Ditylum_brightwellii.AAC.1
MSDLDSDNNSIISINQHNYDVDFDTDNNELGNIWAIYQAHCQKWSIMFQYQRLNWEEHVRMLEHIYDFDGTH